MLVPDADNVPLDQQTWTAVRPIVDAGGTANPGPDAMRSPAMTSRALRQRAESIRINSVVRYRDRLSRPELADDISRRLVEALLAPVLTALHNASGSRQSQLADATCHLFELNDLATR